MLVCVCVWDTQGLVNAACKGMNGRDLHMGTQSQRGWRGKREGEGRGCAGEGRDICHDGDGEMGLCGQAS